MSTQTDALTKNQKLTITALRSNLQTYIDAALSNPHRPFEPLATAINAVELLDGPEPQKADKALRDLAYVDQQWLADDATPGEKLRLELARALVTSRRRFKLTFGINTPS